MRRRNNNAGPAGADPVHMGERIREARRVKNITTTALTKQFGISPSMLSLTERGVNGPAYRLLYALKTHGVSSDWVLRRENATSP